MKIFPLPHEAISVFDIFKIGIGPSSSHTLGPWRAAQRFVQSLKDNSQLFDVTSVRVLLYGSLAKTGKGHCTDVAIQLGLSGDDPVTFAVDQIDAKIIDIKNMKKMVLMGLHEVDFEPSEDIEFLFSESLPFHPNAVTFLATLKNGADFSETFYSIGGGFVVKENEEAATSSVVQLPFPISKADDLLHWCIKTGLCINEVVLENEGALRTKKKPRMVYLTSGE